MKSWQTGVKFCLSDKHIPREKKSTDSINCLLFILIVAYNGDTEIQNSEIILKKILVNKSRQQKTMIYLKAVL